MSESVDFSYREFASMFPEVKTTEQKATTCFWLAEGMLNNTSHSIVCCSCDRKRLLYLLTAHILFLQNRGAGNVGALSSASEGSVSVGYAGLGQLSQNYFGQSQYGLLFWQMAAKYLSGFYVAEEC